MGIKNLLGLLDVSYGDAVDDWTNIMTLPIDCIGVDANCLVYKAIDKPKDVSYFYREVFNAISFVLLRDSIRCTNNEIVVYVSLDNGSPLLKTVTQAKRRQNRDRDQQAKVIDLIKRIKSSQLTSTELEELCLRCAFNLLDFKIRFVFDFDTTKGEGEQKIFKFVKSRSFKNCLLISIDNDTFHIGLMNAEYFENFFFYNPTYKQKLIDVVQCSRIDPNLKYKLFALGNDYMPPLLSGTKDQFELIKQYSNFPDVISGAIGKKMIKKKQSTIEFQFQVFLDLLYWNIYYYRTNSELRDFDSKDILKLLSGSKCRDSILNQWQSFNLDDFAITEEPTYDVCKYNSMVFCMN